MRSINNDQLGYMGLLFVSVMCLAVTLASTVLLGWHLISSRSAVAGANYNDTYHTLNGTSVNTQYSLLDSVQSLNPQEVTRRELGELADELWSLDTHRLQDHALKLNLQSRVNTSNREDKSPERLFKNVNIGNLKRESYSYVKFVKLLDNYNRAVKTPETYSEEEEDEIHNFLLAVKDTAIMKRLHSFLVQKDYLHESVSMFEFLYKIWFTLYNRSTKYTQPDSCGFEHVFVGETRGRKTIGFHNWIQLYSQEKTGKLDYNGYLSYSKPRLLNIQITWDGHRKKETSMFVGTSPEFDMAMYTLCFVVRSNTNCAFTMQQTNINIQTWAMGRVQTKVLGTAYVRI